MEAYAVTSSTMITSVVVLLCASPDVAANDVSERCFTYLLIYLLTIPTCSIEIAL